MDDPLLAAELVGGTPERHISLGTLRDLSFHSLIAAARREFSGSSADDSCVRGELPAAHSDRPSAPLAGAMRRDVARTGRRREHEQQLSKPSRGTLPGELTSADKANSDEVPHSLRCQSDSQLPVVDCYPSARNALSPQSSSQCIVWLPSTSALAYGSAGVSQEVVPIRSADDLEHVRQLATSTARPATYLTSGCSSVARFYYVNSICAPVQSSSSSSSSGSRSDVDGGHDHDSHTGVEGGDGGASPTVAEASVAVPLVMKEPSPPRRRQKCNAESSSRTSSGQEELACAQGPPQLACVDAQRELSRDAGSPCESNGSCVNQHQPSSRGSRASLLLSLTGPSSTAAEASPRQPSPPTRASPSGPDAAFPSPMDPRQNNDGKADPEAGVAHLRGDRRELRAWRYKKEKLIGHGADGKVYKAFDHNSNQYIAVKDIFIAPADRGDTNQAQQDNEKLKTVKKQIEMLRKMPQHPNVVQHRGVERTTCSLSIMMEYIPGGSVAGALSKLGPFAESLVRTYARHICTGLAFLHGHNVTHRDIKCANLLISAQGVVKIADFGSCVFHSIEDAAKGRGIIGTSMWMSPECIKSQVVTDKTDIWSLGCTIVEMATGKPPWHEAHFTNEWAAMFYISQSGRGPPIPPQLSRQAHAFLKRCFAIDPESRPSAAECLDDPFLAEVHDPSSGKAEMQPPSPSELLPPHQFPNAKGGAAGRTAAASATASMTSSLTSDNEYATSHFSTFSFAVYDAEWGAQEPDEAPVAVPERSTIDPTEADGRRLAPLDAQLSSAPTEDGDSVSQKATPRCRETRCRPPSQRGGGGRSGTNGGKSTLAGLPPLPALKASSSRAAAAALLGRSSTSAAYQQGDDSSGDDINGLVEEGGSTAPADCRAARSLADGTTSVAPPVAHENASMPSGAPAAMSEFAARVAPTIPVGAGEVMLGVDEIDDEDDFGFGLPEAVLYNVFHFLDAAALCAVGAVSKRLQEMVDCGAKEVLWKRLFVKVFGDVDVVRSALRKNWKSYFKHSHIHRELLTHDRFAIERQLCQSTHVFEGRDCATGEKVIIKVEPWGMQPVNKSKKSSFTGGGGGGYSSSGATAQPVLTTDFSGTYELPVRAGATSAAVGTGLRTPSKRGLPPTPTKSGASSATTATPPSASSSTPSAPAAGAGSPVKPPIELGGDVSRCGRSAMLGGGVPHAPRSAGRAAAGTVGIGSGVGQSSSAMPSGGPTKESASLALSIMSPSALLRERCASPPSASPGAVGFLGTSAVASHLPALHHHHHQQHQHQHQHATAAGGLPAHFVRSRLPPRSRQYRLPPSAAVNPGTAAGGHQSAMSPCAQRRAVSPSLLNAAAAPCAYSSGAALATSNPIQFHFHTPHLLAHQMHHHQGESGNSSGSVLPAALAVSSAASPASSRPDSSLGGMLPPHSTRQSSWSDLYEYQRGSCTAAGGCGGGGTEAAATVLVPVRPVRSLLQHQFKMTRHLDAMGCQFIPRPLAFSDADALHHNMLVMGPLGPSLNELLLFCGNQMSLRTVAQLTLRLLRVLEQIHEHDVVHGGITPTNIVVGSGERSSDLFLINFGQSRYFRDPRTHRPTTTSTTSSVAAKARNHEFLSFCSTFVQRGCTPAPRDDIIAVGYVLCYLVHGGLPWIHEGKLNSQEVVARKSSYMEMLARTPPIQLHYFLKSGYALKQGEVPDFPYLSNLVNRMMRERGWIDDGIFDWTAQVDSSAPILGK